ncbi:hypothetical protein PISMIDRAFT_679081 [Pisolithus microcarpus 441]|uniref:Uncharacterized protein n=1 Tax=Pisolithus microcarpus 441 TaxID=765257 RepID=A0A0C9ZVF7_9AGAM|nr:hypothetical protein PISMIDRAFT_679081 [Pisolithus microcarpus 441]
MSDRNYYRRVALMSRGKDPKSCFITPTTILLPDRHQKVSSRIWSSWLITRSSRTQLARSSSSPTQQQITSLTYSDNVDRFMPYP